MRRLGHLIVILTQSRRNSKGIMTEHVDKVHEHMLDLFGQAGCPEY